MIKAIIDRTGAIRLETVIGDDPRIIVDWLPVGRSLLGERGYQVGPDTPEKMLPMIEFEDAEDLLGWIGEQEDEVIVSVSGEWYTLEIYDNWRE